MGGRVVVTSYFSNFPFRRYNVGRCGMDINVGDIVKLKKKHPCGSFEWEVLRIGADFRLQCMGCRHQIMIPRKQVEKKLRGLRKTDEKK